MKKVMLLLLICFNLSAASYYIDYDGGNDRNSGTKDKPFKHHPWDMNAEGAAAGIKGANTYYFKKGVIYRGDLIAKEAGESGNPIKFTVDETWGEGKAMLYGSERVSGSWKKCTVADSEIPAAARPNIWYVDLDKSFTPHSAFEITKDNKIVKLDIARSPNWKVSNPDDPRSEWWEWTGAEYEEDKKLKVLEDTKNLTQKETDFWKGAIVWSEDDVCVNPKPTPILSYDPKTSSIKAQFNRGESTPLTYYRYFIEDHPALLDSPNEYYYDENRGHPGRLYLRLEGDRDPNTAKIEVARYLHIFELNKTSNIVIDGLDIGLGNRIDYAAAARVKHGRFFCSGIQLRGAVNNIKVTNCTLEYLPFGIVAYPFEKNDVMDNIEVLKNSIAHIEGSSMHFAVKGFYIDPKGKEKDRNIYETQGRIKHVTVKDNNIFDCGFRNMLYNIEEGDGMEIRGAEVIEVAGNTIDNTGSQGIDVYGGEEYGRIGIDYPFIRVSVHNNKVTNSMRSAQDYGGIEAWMSGPMYMYDNISGNAVGFKYADYKNSMDSGEDKGGGWRRSSFAPGIYMDHQYKGYIFNNIIWGKNNNCNDAIYNTAGIMEAEGFMRTEFNNTIYNTSVGLLRGMSIFNRAFYLNNLIINTSLRYINTKCNEVKTIDWDTLAYSGNVCQGKTVDFGLVGPDNVQYQTIEEFRKFLDTKKALVTETGLVTFDPVVEDAKNHNFMPVKGSPAIDEAKKVFVPWALYKVVGEWGFYKHIADPKIILGESLYFSKAWKDSEEFHKLPRNNLTGVNITGKNFKIGTLEDWVEGALELNGVDQYCGLKDGLEMEVGDGSFLIEAEINGKKGPVVSKIEAGLGYALEIKEDGKLKMSVLSGGVESYRESEAAVNDGNWHHVIAQVDRNKKDGIDIFVDGKLSDGKSSGEIKGDLSNKAVFLVGKKGDAYYTGTIDFLRLSRGTLKDAETTIEELYKWEFDGPFLKDFYGNPASGKARDAGAVEYIGR